MSERKEMGNLFGQDTVEDMEIRETSERKEICNGQDTEEPMETEQPNATGGSFHPAQNNSPNFNPSAGEMTQQGQYPNAMRDSLNPAQNNSPNPHQTAGEMTQQFHGQQGQQQGPMGDSFYPARINLASPQTSARQFLQAHQNPSVNVPNEKSQKDEAQATFSVKWLEDVQQQKRKTTLQKVLLTWANKSKFHGECTVLSVSEDGSAKIEIKPAEAVSILQDLIGQPLKNREGKKILMITTVNLRGMEIQPDKAPVNLPPCVSEPQDVKGQLGEQSHINTSTSNVPKSTDNASVELPSSSVSELQHAKGQLGEQGHMITSSNVLKSTDNASVEFPSSSVSKQQHDQEPPVEQNGSSSSAAVSTREEKTGCLLPVVHFWYVNHIFKEDIKRIEKRHGVKINAEVNVSFEGNQKDKGLKEARSEFTDLVQKHLGDFDGSVTPLKSVDTEDFKNALKMIQRPEHKLLVSLSSEEMTIYGRKPIPTVISKSLNATQTSSSNTYNSAAESQVTSLNIGMSINDHLVNNGLTMQESHWKLMTTSFSDDVDKIKDKFSVDFKDSGVRHGKVSVKAHYKRSGGNASMESHAVRALLHLCQKIATSPKNITQHQGATGFSGSTKNSSSVYPSEGASSGPVANSQSGYSTPKTEDSTREGATAGDKEDEKCPICIDTFKNKKRLKCKHEFCEECLEESKKHSGPVCPVCKDVFGVIEGTQPDGTMSSYESTSSLPGFKDCGTIVIDYHFPSGKQTQRHPNPGQRYHGTSRTAYLPDNKEGKEVLRLLKKAFDQKLIFTVGMSTTTGRENQVTWNDIHHKTSTYGGPQSFGYPDPDYLRRVRDELKAKGIE